MVAHISKNFITFQIKCEPIKEQVTVSSLLCLSLTERIDLFRLFGYNRCEVRQISNYKNISKNFVAIGKERDSGAHILWGNLLHEVMNMEKCNPYSFYVVLADGIMEIPQDSNLSWITLFYALPKELVEKRPTGIHRLIANISESRELMYTTSMKSLILKRIQ